MSITPSVESAPRWTWTFNYQNGNLSSITDPAGRVTQFAIDGNRHLTRITAADGATRRFAYDHRGLMTYTTDENGNITEHLYDTYGRITQVREPAGGGTQRVLTFTPSDTSYPLLNDSPLGDPDSPAPAVPTSGDLAAGVRYGRGGLRGLTYKWGRWLQKSDGLGRATTYQRDETGKLLKRTYQDGTCDTYSYDETGNVLQTSRKEASLCAETSAPLTSFATLMKQGIVQGFSNYSSESLSLETLTTDQDDQRQQESLSLHPSNASLSEQEMVTRLTYEERFNHLKTKTDALGNVTTYVYDYEEGAGEAGNLIRIQYPSVEDENGALTTPTVSYTYNTRGQVTTATDARGVVTRYVYTQGTAAEADTLFAAGVAPAPGLLTQVIQDAGGLNQTTTYSRFDAAGAPGTVTGPGCCGNGQVTHYTYDALGRMHTKTDALGVVTTYDYDPAGNLTRRTTSDPASGRTVITAYSYDPDGKQLSRRTTADGIVSETTSTYDENGKLASQTGANGNTTTYTYDDADQLVSVTDSQNQTGYTYTSKGQLETTTLPTGAVMKAVYNAFGQKVQAIADEQGLALTTAYTYDHNGNLKALTDANLTTSASTYDALNRLTTVEDALGHTTTYRYDLNGNLRFLTDAKEQTTEFVYDALNRLTKEIRPLGETTTYEYDAAGNLVARVDAKGQRTEYDYDPATNQLTDIRYFDVSGAQSSLCTFSYDTSGRLTSYDDGTTSAAYTYDDLGRKLNDTVNYGAFSKTFRYTYSANGQKQSFTMPDGTTYSYTYTDNNGLEDIRIPGVGAIEYPSYTLNRPDNMTFPGGSQSYTYDAVMRLENINAPDAGLNYGYTYDNVSNILTKSTEHGNYGYGYDDVYRLTTADHPTLDDEAYTYDNVGNRETASGVTGTIAHNANNELTLYGEIEYDYDANGNLVRKSLGSVAVNYSYNVANRLIRVEDDLSGLVIVEYGYDPFGRRLWKAVNGARTYFLYADEGLVAEYDASGNELKSYGYNPDSTWGTNPLWLKQNGAYYWYQNDHLGTPHTLIDSNGTVVWEARYNAFGNADILVETVENNLRFPGQYYDAETGLHYNFHRYYDPMTGRSIRRWIR